MRTTVKEMDWKISSSSCCNNYILELDLVSFENFSRPTMDLFARPRNRRGETQSPRSYSTPRAPWKYFPRNGTFLFARFTISAQCFRTASVFKRPIFFSNEGRSYFSSAKRRKEEKRDLINNSAYKIHLILILI